MLIQFIDDYQPLGIKRGEFRNVDDSAALEFITKGIAVKAQQRESDEARLSAKIRDTPNEETR